MKMIARLLGVLALVATAAPAAMADEPCDRNDTPAYAVPYGPAPVVVQPSSYYDDGYRYRDGGGVRYAPSPRWYERRAEARRRRVEAYRRWRWHERMEHRGW